MVVFRQGQALGRCTPGNALYPLCRKLGGAKGLCGQAKNFSSPPAFPLFFNCLLFCLYFIRTCCFSCLDSSTFFLSVFTYNTQHKHPCPPTGYETATPASDRLQILILDRSATGIGGIRSTDRPSCSESLYRLRNAGPHWKHQRTDFYLAEKTDCVNCWGIFCT